MPTNGLFSSQNVLQYLASGLSRKRSDAWRRADHFTIASQLVKVKQQRANQVQQQSSSSRVAGAKKQNQGSLLIPGGG
jgi:hypothetical protein